MLYYRRAGSVFTSQLVDHSVKHFEVTLHATRSAHVSLPKTHGLLFFRKPAAFSGSKSICRPQVVGLLLPASRLTRTTMYVLGFRACTTRKTWKEAYTRKKKKRMARTGLTLLIYRKQNRGSETAKQSLNQIEHSALRKR